SYQRAAKRRWILYRINDASLRGVVVANQRQYRHGCQKRNNAGRYQDRRERVARGGLISIGNSTRQKGRRDRADSSARATHPADRSDRACRVEIGREIEHHGRESGVCKRGNSETSTPPVKR